MGLEGIVSKRLGSHYRSCRSSDWLKFKNPAAPAVQREAKEDWGGGDAGAGSAHPVPIRHAGDQNMVGELAARGLDIGRSRARNQSAADGLHHHKRGAGEVPASRGRIPTTPQEQRNRNGILQQGHQDAR